MYVYYISHNVCKIIKCNVSLTFTFVLKTSSFVCHDVSKGYKSYISKNVHQVQILIPWKGHSESAERRMISLHIMRTFKSVGESCGKVLC